MSKKGNTRSRRRSLRIWGGYLLVLMAWVVAVMALAFLGFIICASITWQPSPLYDFLNWVRDYIVLVCIARMRDKYKTRVSKFPLHGAVLSVTKQTTTSAPT